MAKLALLDHISIPHTNIHRIQGESSDHPAAAQQYEQIIKKNIGGNNQSICFDLILLGLGPDGHIASLFPETTILSVDNKLVAAVYVNKFNSWRISLTYPVLENAIHVLLSATGTSKSTIIQLLFNSKTPSLSQYPVYRLLEKIEWHLDKAATHLLPDILHPDT